MIKHKEQRVGVLVDVANMYHSAKNLYKRRVNFGEILKQVVAGRKLIRATAYVIKTETGEETNFFEALNQQGFEVKMKDLQSGFSKEIAEGRLHFNLIEIEGENQETIDQFVKGKLINLIAFQPHKRSLVYMVFTRNITKKNLFATNVPLLALPVGRH